ncbi:MAG TPA: TAT-variant-translocated molybdopterin oxidoreductase, partial [Candidatus Acidoferrum sp.]|nr:TAT-variant-translocated molybdopterin oxidoreductase [Candidatus Acidoferrum sp.]
MHGATDKLHHEHPHAHGDAHDHDHGHDHDAAIDANCAHDNATQGHPLDLAALRAKLKSKTGKQYWRTLEELADDPQFEQLLHREFPRQASEWDDSVDRRDFLKLMAASL